MGPDDLLPPGETRAFLGAGALGLLGGVVRSLRGPGCTRRAVVVEAVTSIFVSWVVWALLAEVTWMPTWPKIGFIGLCGHVAPKLLDQMGARACQIANGLVPGPKKGE